MEEVTTRKCSAIQYLLAIYGQFILSSFVVSMDG